MKNNVNRSDFKRAFVEANRKDQFSYEALGLLFEYFEQYEEVTGQEIELDVIAICCEYNEDHPADIARNYSIDLTDRKGEPLPDDEMIDIVREYLEDNTTLVGETASGFVYVAF